MVELIYKIYEIFSNIKNISCRLSDIELDGIVIDIEVVSNQKTAFKEYDRWIEYILDNDIDKITTLVHRI